MLLPVMKGMLFVGSKFGFLSCGPNPCAVSSSSPPHPPDSPHADRQELRSGLINAIRLFFLFFFFLESALLMQFEQKRRETERTRRGKAEREVCTWSWVGTLPLPTCGAPICRWGFALRDQNALRCPMGTALHPPPGAAQRVGAPGTLWGCGVGWPRPH